MKSYTRQSRESQRAELSHAYRALEPQEKAVVQFLGVMYEPVSLEQLRDATQHTNTRSAKDRRSESPAFMQLIAKLQEKRLIHVERHGASVRCHNLIVEIATRDAIWEGQFEDYAKAAEKIAPSELWQDRYYAPTVRHAMRLVRLRLYRGQAAELWTALEYVGVDESLEPDSEEPLLRVCNNPFDGAWLATLPAAIRNVVIVLLMNESVNRLRSAEDAFSYLETTCAAGLTQETRAPYRSILGDQYIWRGRIADALEHVDDVDNIDVLARKALLALLKGNWEAALAGYDEALASLRRASGKRTAGLWAHHDGFYALALLRSGEVARLKTARELLKRNLRDDFEEIRIAHAALLELVESALGQSPRGSTGLSNSPEFAHYPPVDLLLQCLVMYWSDAPKIGPWITLLETHQAAAMNAGYTWFAAEMGEVIARASSKVRRYPELERFYEETGLRPLADMIRKEEAWERSLHALTLVADLEEAPRSAAAAELRLAWHMVRDFNAPGGVTLEAREVKQRSTGAWTKGKVISLKRLATERDAVPYLIAQDLEVCAHIVSKVERGGYYGTPKVMYHVQPGAWLALVGHPLVFSCDGAHIEVTRGEPELHVVQQGNHVTVELVPPLPEGHEVCLVHSTPTRLNVIPCTAAHRRIAGIVHTGLRVPVEHKARVLEMLTRVTSLITVHSSIGGGLANVPEVPADPRLHVILLPVGDGLRMQIMVQPLAQGTYYRPGAGGETVLAEVEGRRVQTRRNLKQEQEQFATVVESCSALEFAEYSSDEWSIADLELCLELLEQLHDLGDAIVVEWPQGEKLRVSNRAALGNLHVKVTGGRDWFEASGQLQCGNDRVFDMRQLLTLLEQTEGRFLPLGEGQFLALTKEFRKRLDEFRALSERHGDGARFHPLAAPAVDGLFDGDASVNANKAWKAHLAKFREAQSFDPAVPSTLRATLRDYQVEGYQWMARLAQWGAGACLADDMGLGKTVQALALVLSHASEGPTLVIAPTSVCMNWMVEAQRFAPTLNPILFGAGDRQATLDALKPYDVLVCSYGLLHQESEKLTAIQWRVAVLDEAQAIKNMATRRSQAAMTLKADFRLITTGTPIENHLGELWNLFRFINPGLLRSLEQFNQRFAIPIEKLQDRDARARLKKIIQPFILRRLKEQVLEELPSRTEIVLHVEFSDDEAAFYEALRRQAVDKIAGVDGTPGQKHLRILAEIMRLRRACCNAKLVTPGVKVPSAKLGVFLNLVDELLENRHKALVFSQFVDHLAILRDALDARGIAYQYLDGSTSQRERKRRVDAFQAGEGDLFLISLKAGGLGINLTAADYVIHMDPWWNPAAEDQASDRAHRIGQVRPVTIYRLVTEGTIESRIVELHKHKRDLADSLLDGAEMSGKMTADELLALLQEGM